jgi:hypothetical protein
MLDMFYLPQMMWIIMALLILANVSSNVHVQVAREQEATNAMQLVKEIVHNATRISATM